MTTQTTIPQRLTTRNMTTRGVTQNAERVREHPTILDAPGSDLPIVEATHSASARQAERLGDTERARRERPDPTRAVVRFQLD